jgi:TBC1 domain family member 10
MNQDQREIDKYGFLRTSGQVKQSSDQLKENARVEKWSKMLRDWDRYIQIKYKKLKHRIRKGIPSCVRGKVWYILSGAEAIKENYPKDHYAALLSLEIQKSVETDIILDLERTYPNHIKFRGTDGRDILYRVLRAYAVMDPEVSYTQGMSFIAAMFLIFLTEEESFWLLVTILTQYDFRGFYIQGMPKLYQCFYVSNGLLKHFLPRVFKNFRKENLSVSMYATQWFMTGFSSSFNIESALRIWDCFFYEGFKVIYRVYLAILEKKSKQLAKCSFERIMEIIRSIGNDVEADSLLKNCFKFSLSQKLINRLENDYRTQPKPKYVDWVVTKQ